jgi:hypothetical protein
VISQDVFGTVTVQVFAGFSAFPELSKAETVYELGELPVVGAVIVTVALASPATTVGVPGGPGETKLDISQFPILLLSVAAPDAFTGLKKK